MGRLDGAPGGAGVAGTDPRGGPHSCGSQQAQGQPKWHSHPSQVSLGFFTWWPQGIRGQQENQTRYISIFQACACVPLAIESPTARPQSVKAPLGGTDRRRGRVRAGPLVSPGRCTRAQCTRHLYRKRLKGSGRIRVHVGLLLYLSTCECLNYCGRNS